VTYLATDSLRVLCPNIISARKAMEKMVDLRHELGGDVKHSLMELHKNTNNTEIGMPQILLL
jgi:hypothetical protein